jgi:hypothetical protein
MKPRVMSQFTVYIRRVGHLLIAPFLMLPLMLTMNRSLSRVAAIHLRVSELQSIEVAQVFAL